MSEVPDFLPSESDLGPTKAPADVDRFLSDLRALVNSYRGRLTRATIVGALAMFQHYTIAGWREHDRQQD
jgi:hypothetical protein